jgi:hypothetical protein
MGLKRDADGGGDFSSGSQAAVGAAPSSRQVYLRQLPLAPDLLRRPSVRSPSVFLAGRRQPQLRAGEVAGRLPSSTRTTGIPTTQMLPATRIRWTTGTRRQLAVLPRMGKPPRSTLGKKPPAPSVGRRRAAGASNVRAQIIGGDLLPSSGTRTRNCCPSSAVGGTRSTTAKCCRCCGTTTQAARRCIGRNEVHPAASHGSGYIACAWPLLQSVVAVIESKGRPGGRPGIVAHGQKWRWPSLPR